GAVAVRCPSIGWRIRVAVATPPTAAPMPGAGGALNPADIVVRRGDLVELIVQARGFVATTTGIADQDGAIGQRIRIRVDRRASPCFGQVMADGRISVAGF
ncbi:MAG: flagella basal body P-ring formation protein FlgA, partial [Sphingopyxis sp.]